MKLTIISASHQILVFVTILTNYGFADPNATVPEEMTSSLSFIVSIQLNRRHICTGSLIEDDIVLTAGHCISSIQNIKDLTIQTNTDDKIHAPTDLDKRYVVTATKIHPNASQFDHDIGLIKLSEPVEHVNGVESLPITNPTQDELTDKDFLIMAAWGFKKSAKFTKKLSQVRIKLKEMAKCQERFNLSLSKEGLICGLSYYTKICRGDGGAPLFKFDMTTGSKELISLLVYSSIHCAADLFLSVRVSTNYAWIEGTKKMIQGQ